MISISRDVNNNIYFIATTIVEAETKDNWSWFRDLWVILVNVA
jgi:hypothetical protein